MASNAANTVTEYDFVKEPSRDYFCPITFELLRDPQQTNTCCGKHLSRVAAEKLQKEGKPCPLCHATPLKTADDLFFRRKVMELKVYCSNKSTGCKWKGEVGKLDSHLKLGSVEGKCHFVDVLCPLKCGKRFQRRYLENHQYNKCEKRQFACQYCNYEATYEEVVNDHWPKCQRYPEVCPNKCSIDVIERRFLQRHLDEECKLQEIECKFSHAGCETKMQRQKMPDHLKSTKDEHLELVSVKCRMLKTEVTDLKVVISQIIPKPVFIPPPEMVMNNFDKLKNDDTFWFSPPFYTHVGGYKMCLCIDTNGYAEFGEGTHVRLDVNMMKGEFDSHLKWPFKGEVTVQLVNQKEGGENFERKPLEDINYDDCVKYFQRVTEGDMEDDGWGSDTFISHTDLYKPEEGKEYLKNDTLIFKVTEVVVTSV